MLSQTTSMSLEKNTSDRRSTTRREMAMIDFLGQHYGDGVVYLRSSHDRLLYHHALERGLINEEGYLTPAGFKYWRSKGNG